MLWINRLAIYGNVNNRSLQLYTFDIAYARPIIRTTAMFLNIGFGLLQESMEWNELECVH